MKEINGTVTLAYLEEDNKQRVIFRVVPLCTREGSAFHGDAESFPDEGSMRVVPDKREQSTFKERMRAIGALCAVCLVSDGSKELMKVRPNRNYAPDQGERNQFAIYSDVICEFAPDGCFEVVEQGAVAGEALTDKVLLYKNKMLYGPVDRQSASGADVAELKPFGNDSFLLQTVETPSLGKRRIYWNPDATVNWRQRRGATRRRAAERAADEDAATDEAPALPESATGGEPTAVAAVAASASVQGDGKPAPAQADNNLVPAESRPAFAQGVKPAPADGKPAPAENKPAPVQTDSKPAPAESRPAFASAQADGKPAPAEGKPAPAQTDNKPALAESKPASASAPADGKPAPAENKSVPAQTANQPAPVESKPAQTDGKPASAQSANQPAPAPSAKPAQTAAKPARPAPAEAPAQPSRAKPAQDAKPEGRQRRQERARDRREADARPDEQSLPIGSRLEILDAALPFDEQIDRLAQPLSENANRLTDLPDKEPEEDTEEVVARFSGTPLVKAAVRLPRSSGRPEPVHRVVEQQLRGQRDEVMGAELGESAYGMVNNPIENLQSCVDYIWQNADMRRQALETLMGNESFMDELVRALRQKGMNLQATAAAQEQLSEIEAERLGLLMQLESAKANEAKFREEAIASLNQRKREESERLKREIRDLTERKKTLDGQLAVLSGQNAQQLTEYIAQHMTCLTGVGEQRILLSPVVGHDYAQAELAEQLRVHMNDSGFSLSDDEAMSLLINFSLYDALCLRGPSVRDAISFAKVLLESFGLESTSAVVMPGAYVEMICLLPEDLRRTPTVTVQPLGTETMSVYGHKTIFLTDGSALPEDGDLLANCPVVSMPPLTKHAFGYADEWRSIAPASLKAFANVRGDAHPLLEEAEKWFRLLAQELSERQLLVPETSVQCMRRFVEIASRKVRGGFIAAADSAVASWIVPLLLRKADLTSLPDILTGLPRTLDLLGMR